MAGQNQIPPLFILDSTPPPLDDFDDDDEDHNEINDDNDDNFGDFETTKVEDNTFPLEDHSIPTTPSKVFPASPTETSLPEIVSDESEKKQSSQQQPEIKKDEPKSISKSSPTSSSNIVLSRNESPPSLILSQTNYSEDDEDDIYNNEYEQAYAQQTRGENSQTNEDNLSIPSLNFDVENASSKRETPVHQLYDNTIESSEKEIVPPLSNISNNIDDEVFYKYDDNTENDFTDFTSVSNEKSTQFEPPSVNNNDYSIDEDFAQIESAPSIDSNFVSQSKTDNIDHTTFDADFSKFDTFQAFSTSESNKGESDWACPSVPIATATSIELEDDDFDDFQDFVASQPVNVDESKKSDIVKDIDEEFDEFDDFTDFKQSIPQKECELKPLVYSHDKFLMILNSMFPVVDVDCSHDNENIDGINNKNKMLDNLKDIDTSNAIGYQYSNSETSKTLVKSLGIDSRNILYGPKWNISMPRFAANLSFNPLEPIKFSTAATSTASSIPTLSTSSSSSSLKLEPTSVASYSQASNSQTSSTSSTLPAAQFDWNSAGLINPLDASHAHTLLLDLDEIEVMTKLKDKLNIDSMNVPPSLATNNNKLLTDAQTLTNSCNRTILGDGSTLDGSTLDKNHKKYSFDDYLDFSVQEMLNQEGANQSKAGSKSEILDKKVAEVSDTTANAPNEPSISSLKLEKDANLDTLTVNKKTDPSIPENDQLNEKDERQTIFKLMPNVRTIKLPETHIFTPHKSSNPISQEVTDRNDDFVVSHDDNIPKADKGGIVIKEYRDLEYSLEKKSNDDEFSEFQSVPAVISKTVDKKNKVEKYSKPIFGVSPTEELEKSDDEFSDFQAATLSRPTISDKKTPKSNSSSILLSPTVLMPQRTNYEAIRHGSKINWPNPGISSDELSRFEAAFSSNPSANHPDDDDWTEFVSSQPLPKPATESTSKINSSQNDDDWTDFISSAPISSTSSSQKYNFTSLPPKFNSWNSSNLYYSHPPIIEPQKVHAEKVPPTLFYNNNNHFPSAKILPDMNFVGTAAKSSSSFINNMLTNNHFMKK